MTLAELAEKLWKKEHGDKTYEQVEAEYVERRKREMEIICQDLPYKKVTEQQR